MGTVLFQIGDPFLCFQEYYNTFFSFVNPKIKVFPKVGIKMSDLGDKISEFLKKLLTKTIFFISKFKVKISISIQYKKPLDKTLKIW